MVRIGNRIRIKLKGRTWIRTRVKGMVPDHDPDPHQCDADSQHLYRLCGDHGVFSSWTVLSASAACFYWMHQFAAWFWLAVRLRRLFWLAVGTGGGVLGCRAWQLHRLPLPGQDGLLLYAEFYFRPRWKLVFVFYSFSKKNSNIDWVFSLCCVMRTLGQYWYTKCMVPVLV